jgi:diketogulonate reductase-like aldo/keto reductase
MVAGFERLRAAGKIRQCGVSNFNVRQMEGLFKVRDGDYCATNQVPYNLSDRRIERDLLPWCEQHGMPIMAYSPLGGQGGTLVKNPALARIGAAHNCSAAAVALAWTIRGGNVIAIPESGSAAHVKENAVALSMALAPEEPQMLDADFPTRLSASQPQLASARRLPMPIDIPTGAGAADDPQHSRRRAGLLRSFD